MRWECAWENVTNDDRIEEKEERKYANMRVNASHSFIQLVNEIQLGPFKIVTAGTVSGY